MLEIIRNAAENFCTNIIGENLQSAKYAGENFYGAAIGLHVDGNEEQWYLLFKKNTLNVFAQALLFENNLSEEELDDLIKEVANLIIGSAKVLLKEHYPQKNFHIDTPDFLGHVPNIKLLDLEEFLLCKIKNRTFVIGKKVEK